MPSPQLAFGRPVFNVAVLALYAAAALGSPQTQKTPPPTPKPSQAKPPSPGPAAPQSTHFPILLLAFGSDPTAWSVRIGQHGPERLDRPGFPPIVLDPVDVNREGTNDTWNYRAKDSSANAEITVRLTREVCTDAAGAKFPFHALAEHTQLGALNGCARIAAELFPKITNQLADEDSDPDKKTPPVLPADVIKFKLPFAIAYLNPAGKIIVSVNSVRKIAAPAGSDLSLSHDGKRLLYVREDSKDPAGHTIVLYEFASGRSRDLVKGPVRQPCWSPDDTRIAFLNQRDQKWQVWTFAPSAPDAAAPLYVNNVESLQGWVDPHTLLATDAQNAYWIPDAGSPMQSVDLKEMYGPYFKVGTSDTLRANPQNPGLLLVSADYAAPPPNVPTGSKPGASGFFLYEVRTRRRSFLSPPDQSASEAEWSRDGVQVFYTRKIGSAASTYRILWDASGGKRYLDVTGLSIGE